MFVVDPYLNRKEECDKTLISILGEMIALTLVVRFSWPESANIFLIRTEPMFTIVVQDQFRLIWSRCIGGFERLLSDQIGVTDILKILH